MRIKFCPAKNIRIVFAEGRNIMKRKCFSKTLILSGAIIIALALCYYSLSAKPDAEAEKTEQSSSVSEAVVIAEPQSEPEPEQPKPSVIYSSSEVEQGSFMTVCIENYDGESIVYNDFLGNDRSFFKCGDIWVSYIPVKTSAKTGTYTFDIEIDDICFENEITVTNRDFPLQYLTVSEKTIEETLENDYAKNEFATKAEPLKYTATPEKLWEGEFILPLNSWYSVTTKFGSFRTFSNGATEWHNAIDMAAGGGTPIYATNSGTIIFAEFLQYTGNTVIIDHGMGVLSWHYHMDTIKVSEGDFVEKGDKIGTVGTTGLSTGNHLHFGITVGGIFTDPMKIVGTEPQIYLQRTE